MTCDAPTLVSELDERVNTGEAHDSEALWVETVQELSIPPQIGYGLGAGLPAMPCTYHDHPY